MAHGGPHKALLTVHVSHGSAACASCYSSQLPATIVPTKRESLVLDVAWADLIAACFELIIKALELQGCRRFPG